MKYLKVTILTIISLGLMTGFAFASDPIFKIRPDGGKVKLNSTFLIDILIDSKDNEVSFARASLKFDPEYLQVVKAERNSSLFCSYPEEEQKIDNEIGGLVVAGFCQSGVGTPYLTKGEADVFARVTFKALKQGEASLSWQFSGQDSPNMSVIIKDGSPPQNILLDSPKDSVFEIVKTTSSTTPKPVVVPSTGFNISIWFISSGILLVVLGFVYVKWSDSSYKKKLRTVVVFGDDK